MTTWLLLAAAILSEVTATLALRGALDDPALYVVVAAGYVLSFVLLAQVLRRGMGLGVAYGLWGASGVVLTAVASAALFGEAMTTLKIAGFVLIAAGVVVVELGAQRARRGDHPVPQARESWLAASPSSTAAAEEAR
ncbi:DMT family transporter [Brachybacterium saurashtrense]|uniref:QacE family quaternary ammonium compound efflux SMR transporter n=1 Tax=Brachybacterium saurashtrense TaxID=556288 RepID=A0A345YRF4_9MICO|nr:multidrug efflux SMR transporter [Brachybacterium saurashtrense]AXK46506.1 QacE family quaternary ammonium compound efflux SMR transporter [Brachybacterium saurashtrense]RRR24247.1 QacE family quaternary ammonium compound efflux SMR transporter [Brachybacterium saurashtrense]